MLTLSLLFVCVRRCMGQDEVLFQLAEEVKNFAVVYLVDITEVPDFNTVRRESDADSNALTHLCPSVAHSVALSSAFALSSLSLSLSAASLCVSDV